MGKYQPIFSLNTKMSMGRLEVPTNGLKGYCSTIELNSGDQIIISTGKNLSWEI